jgi:outer membrane receptor protein involved in Fe transport
MIEHFLEKTQIAIFSLNVHLMHLIQKLSVKVLVNEAGHRFTAIIKDGLLAFLENLNVVWCLAAYSFVVFFLAELSPGNAFAQAGKISGTVKDSKTGEPLVGASIYVEGRVKTGTTTGLDGTFSIIDVPAGTYTIRVTYIGYRPVYVQNVEVNVGLTAHITISMESAALQTQPVEVVASRPLVRKDETSTVRIYSGSQLKNSVGIYSVSDIFRLQPGAVIIPSPQSVTLPNGRELQLRDESVTDVHIRGGRGGEILFLVNGMPVTHPLYGGRDVLDLDISDVQQVQMITGAFDAEYGQAQSGVVNIITNSPSDTLSSTIQYKTDQPMRYLDGNVHQFNYATFSLGGPDPVGTALLKLLGHAQHSTSGFYLSSNLSMTNTPYNMGSTRGDWHILGIPIKQRQENNAGLNLELTSSWGAGHMELAYDGSWMAYSPFNWLWKNYPDHMASYKRNNNYMYLTFTTGLSNTSFIDFGISYLTVSFKGSLNGATPPSFWTPVLDSTGRLISMVSKVHYPTIDPTTGFYDAGSYETIWRDDFTRTLTAKADISLQIAAHLMKAGFQLQYNDLSYIDIEDGGVALSPYGQFIINGGTPVPPPPGPYKEFGQNRWVFHSFPMNGAAYVQDKFEKEFMVMNAGLRLDWFSVGNSVFDPAWVKQWVSATGLTPDWKRFRYKLSPRFGVSFPVSTSTVTYFSYGIFYQLPEMQFFYRDPYSGGITGNPGLDYEETNLYEFGLTTQLGKQNVLDIKLFNREMSKQIETTQLKAAAGVPVNIFDNKGYARAHGLELAFEERRSANFFGRISYTLQWANGYSSSEFSGYINSLNDIPNPIRERRVDWDIRHQVILDLIFTVPKSEHLRVMGLPLPDDWDASALCTFTSGLPYTPGTTDPVVAQETVNSASGPFNLEVDVRLRKSFDAGSFRFSLIAEIYNLLNLKNIQIGYGFNPWTGAPYKYGDLIPTTNEYYDWRSVQPLMDPRVYSDLRYVKIGLSIIL